ncbi:hypothetical protein D5F11_011405 [Siminovitchia terrae]|uniref:Uncharacterized protein n=1 Tax=Siminovitchia terrae TaxID=1914933 RepID=A0A429X8W3_SIMTE|nr:hypothetical protein [Siminovitchia terrae]RST59701.1 hypothetical protein D5F11_011405 [Siminovitchia terrae]
MSVEESNKVMEILARATREFDVLNATARVMGKQTAESGEQLHKLGRGLVEQAHKAIDLGFTPNEQQKMCRMLKGDEIRC